MSGRLRLTCAAAGLVLGLQSGSQYVGWAFSWSPALGPGLAMASGTVLYPPWAVLGWRRALADKHPDQARTAGWQVLLGLGGGLAAALAADGGRRGPPVAWGGLSAARKAGLTAKDGCVIGELKGKVLATRDLRPTLVTGGTRSGKGRGHVVPTLLSWRQSVLVHDPKSELWPITSGFRSRFSSTLCFDPRAAAGARWNPLAEIVPGRSELAQVQRLAAILSDPGGTRDDEAIWDKAATEILEAVILHVLYAAKDGAKTLLTVREMLADLDASVDVMARTHHRAGPDGAPQCHPFIAIAVRGHAAMHDRFRTSVQGTARSYLKWLAGDDLERTLSTSDFCLCDLMSAPRPVSLYVQVAPADAAALRPLVRLIFQAATQALTTEETRDARGGAKRHQLLLVMDEFPLLGRLEFFEKSLRLMSGYGLKAMLVAQSLNDIVETYGPHNTILDNCHAFTAFSALDPMTQEKVSRLTGTQERVQISRNSPQFPDTGRTSLTRSMIERPRMSPGEIGALAHDAQLVFTPGAPPILARKLRYDRRSPFRQRASLPPHDQAARLDAPPPRLHPWEGRRALGISSEQTLPLFKENEAAIAEKRAAAKAEEHYSRAAARIAEEIGARDAALDQMRRRNDGQT